MAWTNRELKRFEKLCHLAGVCNAYGKNEDPGRIAVGFFFYGEHACELADETCELINKLGEKTK